MVSSPGTERPLKFPRQYGKHIGRILRVIAKADGSQKTVEGRLTGMRDEGIDLKVEGKDVVEIRFADIVEARVLPAW